MIFRGETPNDDDDCIDYIAFDKAEDQNNSKILDENNKIEKIHKINN
jgi:hypothetical protein